MVRNGAGLSRMALIFVLLLCTFPLLAARGATVVPWSAAGALEESRYAHTATLLDDGRVLVSGGATITDGVGAILRSAELYDPVSDTWSRTDDMTEDRGQHTSTLLPDGRVLVAGGDGNNVGGLASAELYDPDAGSWTPVASMNAGRSTHTATLLFDGTVLVTGGYSGTATPIASAERYDPIADTWETVDRMVNRRGFHTATLLDDGSVLVVGGDGPTATLRSAERYDADLDLWVAQPTMVARRQMHTATLLPDGNVLIAGGLGRVAEGADVHLATTEIYSPASETWSAGASLSTPRSSHAAVALLDGLVLITAGTNATGEQATSELLRDNGMTTIGTSPLIKARTAASATLLADGSVLLAGGYTYVPTLKSIMNAERYLPNQAPVAGSPIQVLRLAGLGTSTVPLTISWPAAIDTDGLDHFALEQEIDDGGFVEVSQPFTSTGRTVTLTSIPGAQYQHRVRAFDVRLASSAWAYSRTVDLLAVQEADAAIAYSGAWDDATNASFFGGGAKYASTAGATATVTFTGASVGWVTTQGNGRGIVEIWLDGVKVRTVDLYTPTLRRRQLLFARNGLARTEHTLEIRVTGTHNQTSTGARVDLDAFIVID